jgi:hypothetical protein
VELADTVRERRTITVINVPNKTPKATALDLCPLPLDPPVVDGLEEGLDLVLLEPELGGVDPQEGKRALVPSHEVELQWEEMGQTEIEVCPALVQQ